jgi:hypothetical protein
VWVSQCDEGGGRGRIDIKARPIEMVENGARLSPCSPRSRSPTLRVFTPLLVHASRCVLPSNLQILERIRNIEYVIHFRGLVIIII